MKSKAFQLSHTLDKLKHYLPSQRPLKDFIHHNTLHAFQHLPFERATCLANRIFGYRTALSLREFNKLYDDGKINELILDQVIVRRYGQSELAHWKDRLKSIQRLPIMKPRIGKLQALWKDHYHLDLLTIVHSNLFRLLNGYLDQGIAIRRFPVKGEGLLRSIAEMEQNTFVSIFKTKSARELLLNPDTQLKDLLERLIGDEGLYEQYLFDQQFAHPGWSGMVAMIEQDPLSLMDGRTITLAELIFLECLLEIDNLTHALGKDWKPIAEIGGQERKLDLWENGAFTEIEELIHIWQEAMEWTYYDQVLAGVQLGEQAKPSKEVPSFQAFFCIDDREGSLRRYIEYFDKKCATYGTPGHFGIDAYYQPQNGKFYTKICPAPVKPRHLIKEVSARGSGAEMRFMKSSHGLVRGWLISQTVGFWSAIRLMFNIFRPSLSPTTSHSFAHMDAFATITVENRSTKHTYHGLTIGYTVEEMADRVETVLRGAGTVARFAPLVYMIGHGASTTNNTHYAGYDCGACSGRPGSVNARAFCYMANHKGVRSILKSRGLVIPDTTEFIGGMHDTTRDEFRFYDEDLLAPANSKLHEKNIDVFEHALKANAKERSRRMVTIDSKASLDQIHEKVKRRSMALFEPRPELNHATNALCIIGRKQVHDHLFLDRRAFINTYDYSSDPDGRYLQAIVHAAVPVSGGINMEYYFSRTDNEQLGAGSKLPHNVMGLIGVSNGFEGDLRPGLPWQMVEVHDPLRLMTIIEHVPEVVLKVIQSSAQTYEWFANQWMHLCVVNPDDGALYRFQGGRFDKYVPVTSGLQSLNLEEVNAKIESTHDSLPVFMIKSLDL